MTPNGTADRMIAKYGHEEAADLAASMSLGAKLAIAFRPDATTALTAKWLVRAEFWSAVLRNVERGIA